MALGLAIAWGGLIPLLTAAQPMPGAGLEAWVGAVFRQDVRFFGAGVSAASPASAVAAFFVARLRAAGLASAAAASASGATPVSAASSTITVSAQRTSYALASAQFITSTPGADATAWAISDNVGSVVGFLIRSSQRFARPLNAYEFQRSVASAASDPATLFVR